MRRPLVGICIFIILGILLAKFIHIKFIFLFSLTVLLFILSLLFLRVNPKFKLFILLSFFLLGAMLLENSKKLPAHHIQKYIGYKGRLIVLKGVVDSGPLIKNMGYFKKASFIFNVQEIQHGGIWQKTCGKVLMNSFQNRKFFYGQKLILEGKIYLAPEFAISEKFDYREYLRRKQIFGILSVKKNSPVEIIEENSANPIKSFSLKIRNKLSQQIDSYLAPVESSLLRAMLLGERHDIPKFINDIFIQTGTIHILAISGLNIGIIAFIILLFLKVVRIPRNIRYVAAILFLILYVFITGSPISVIRATIMFIVFLGGFLFERESDIFNSLALSCILILGVNPNQLFDIGFQLSFVSVLSIVIFTPKIENYVNKIYPQKDKIFTFVIRPNSVSLAAWLGVLGIIAYNFNVVTPIAIIANLFIIPFMVIVFALGMCFIAMSLAFPMLGLIFAGSVSLSLFILIKFTYFLSRIPGACFNLPLLPWYAVFGYYILLLGLFYLPNFIRLRLEKTS